jgi:aminodeoxyfutalosine synthase
MLEEIVSKLNQSKRLTPEEGLYLLEEVDLETVKKLADQERKKKCGDTVYYASTLFVHPTNLCELSCPMCSFYAKPGWKSAWFSTPEMIENKIKEAYPYGLTEIHVVGGLWRDCDLNYYQDLFGRIKAIDPKLHIKALTPVEYDFLSKLHHISVEEVFEKMMSFGLGSLPGGGAEILNETIRKQVAPQKISSERYLEIHKIAHQIGLPSNITMLFGHVEDNIHIIEHLSKIRTLQDETNGFNTFIPLKYHDENNALGKRKGRLKEKNLQRIYAVSRLMLDNVRNLKVLWNYVGVKEAQDILSCGANDFASTSQEEKVIIMAGGVKVAMTRDLIAQYIKEAGKKPLEINSGYSYKDELLLC